MSQNNFLAARSLPNYCAVLTLGMSILLASSGIAHGQDVPSSAEVSVSPVFDVPLGSSNDFLAQEMAFKASALFPIWPWLYVGLAGSKGFAGSSGNIHSSISTVTTEVEIGRWLYMDGGPFGKGNIKPYFSVGGGYYRVNSSEDVEPPSPDDSMNGNYGGYSVAAGLLAQWGTDNWGRHFALGPEARFHFIVASATPDYNYFSAGLRLMFLF